MKNVAVRAREAACKNAIRQNGSRHQPRHVICYFVIREYTLLIHLTREGWHAIMLKMLRYMIREMPCCLRACLRLFSYHIVMLLSSQHISRYAMFILLPRETEIACSLPPSAFYCLLYYRLPRERQFTREGYFRFDIGIRWHRRRLRHSLPAVAIAS